MYATFSDKSPMTLFLSLQIEQNNLFPDNSGGKNKVVKDMKVPSFYSRLKKERDHYKRQAHLLRMERERLRARLEAIEAGNQADAAIEVNAGNEVDAANEADAADAADAANGANEADAANEAGAANVVDDNIDDLMVFHNVDNSVQPQQVLDDQQGDVANQPQSVSCEVDYQDFELFLKFKNFLSLERQQQEPLQTLETIAQPKTESVQEAMSVGNVEVDLEGSKRFVIYPDGKVFEILDIASS